jgi:hypothetical protein
MGKVRMKPGIVRKRGSGKCKIKGMGNGRMKLGVAL